MPVSTHKLKPNFSEKFTSTIWKIEIDEKQDIIAIETRNKTSHSAAFSVFNYTTATCYFKEKSPQDSWKWGLDRIHEGAIYLHSYNHESSPEHRGIIAWDSKTGKTKWQQFNYALDTISDQGLIVYNPLIQSARRELISAETGQPVKGIVPENMNIKRHILFPKIYNDLLSLPDFIPVNAVEPFLYLNYNGKSCWAFHIKSSYGFTQKLVIALDKEVILTDNLDRDIQKLNPEAFFIYKSHLFCIRDSCEIVSYLL